MYEFPCPQPITASITFAAGSCDIVAEDTDTATVDIRPHGGRDEQAVAAARVELRGDQLVVDIPDNTGWLGRHQPRLRIAVRVPTGSKVRAKVASADVTAHGQLAELSANTASGDLHAHTVTGDVAFSTASGDVRLEHVGGSVRGKTASGEITIGTAGGDVSAESASGDITIEHADASVRTSTASGDVHVGVARRGAVEVKSASGDAQIGVAAGTKVWLDLSTFSGKTSSNLAAGDAPTTAAAPAAGATLTLHVQTLSGDIDVRRVEVADRV